MIGAIRLKKQKPFTSEGLFNLPAVWTGLEPATPCVTGMYSNQLNYQTSILDDITPDEIKNYEFRITN